MTALDWSAVDGLAARAAERAGEAESLRRLPDATIVEAARLGVFDLVTPPEFGGRGGGLRDLAELGRRLAHGCTSTGWTLSLLAMHNWLLSRFSRQAQVEVWAERPHALVPAPLAPGGSAEVADGGIRVSGEWAWGTGVMHADWVLVHVLVDPATADLRFALLPVGDVEVRDVWHTSGMRGTGSNTVVVDGVLVPHHRTVPSRDLMEGVGSVDAADPLAAYPVVPVLSMVAAAPALGAAERCVELVGSAMGDRVLAYTVDERQAEKPAAQVRLAAALASVRAARAYWDAALGSLDEVMAEGRPPTLAERAGWRLAATATVDSARRAIDDLTVGAGGSVYFEQHPLQRFQRDVNTLKGHVIFDWDRTMELVGRIEIGLDAGPMPML